MAIEPIEEHEVHAARNQSLFRAVNEKLRELNEAFATITETFGVTCECADVQCVQMLTIRPPDYTEVRRQPRRFVVAPGHVIPDVEIVVAETAGYVVVEKIAGAGEVAERMAASNRLTAGVGE